MRFYEWTNEQISIAKRVPSKDVPDAYCVTTDHIEVPKVALTKQFQNVCCSLLDYQWGNHAFEMVVLTICLWMQFLKDLEDHLDYMVITDMNTRQIVCVDHSGMELSFARIYCMECQYANSSIIPFVCAVEFRTRTSEFFVCASSCGRARRSWIPRRLCSLRRT